MPSLENSVMGRLFPSYRFLKLLTQWDNAEKSWSLGRIVFSASRTICSLTVQASLPSLLRS